MKTHTSILVQPAVEAALTVVIVVIIITLETHLGSQVCGEMVNDVICVDVSPFRHGLSVHFS